MSKFYVELILKPNGIIYDVLNAENGLQSCVLSWQKYKKKKQIEIGQEEILKGSRWRVNEQGFLIHSGDLFFSDQQVIEAVKFFENSS